MSSDRYLSIRWAGIHLEDTQEWPLDRALPPDGMRTVHSLGYAAVPDDEGNVIVDDVLGVLMPTLFEEDALIALDLQGRVLATGDLVWDCQLAGADDGVYLGVTVACDRLIRRWNACGAEIAAALAKRYPTTHQHCAENIAAFIARLDELQGLGLRPLVHLGAFDYSWRHRGFTAYMLGLARSPFD